LPKKGFTTITVPDRVHDRLSRIAEESHRSVPKLIEHMLEKMYPQKEGED